MIEINKKYKTRSGLPVRVLANDLNSRYPICAAVLEKETEYVYCFTKDGLSVENEKGPDDLIEVNPYEDFKVDDLCVVWEVENCKEFRHFSHEVNGLAYCFTFGRTSYTTIDKTSWLNCRKATEEEIRTKTIKD